MLIIFPSDTRYVFRSEITESYDELIYIPAKVFEFLFFKSWACMCVCVL